MSGFILALIYHATALTDLKTKCIPTDINPDGIKSEGCVQRLDDVRYPKLKEYALAIHVLNLISVVFSFIGQWFRYKWQQPFIKQTVLDTYLKSGFFLQIVILMLSPYPEDDKVDKRTNSHVSDIIFAFMFCRFFFVARAIFNYSQYKSRFVNMKCMEYRVQPNNWFIFKLFLVKNKIMTVMAIFFMSIFFFSVIILCFEVEYFMQSGE